MNTNGVFGLLGNETLVIQLLRTIFDSEGFANIRGGWVPSIRGGGPNSWLFPLTNILFGHAAQLTNDG